MRKFLCRIGVHSWFRQYDRWGSADVCHYCIAVRNESTVSVQGDAKLLQNSTPEPTDGES